jgi:spermidine synthase
VQPWRNLDEATTKDGKLVLRQRGERDFLLTIDGRVLMSSMLHRSEDSLAKLAFERIATLPKPRVLTAGLGLGFTLRALLDVLPRGAHVEVAELHDVIVRWCEGPLAPIHQHRITQVIGPVVDVEFPAGAVPADPTRAEGHQQVHQRHALEPRRRGRPAPR